MELDFLQKQDMQSVADQIITLSVTYGMKVIGAIVILVLGWMVAGWVSRRITKVMQNNTRVEKTLVFFFASLARYAILAFTIIGVLNQFGVQTASLIAVLGAAGLAIGLALQGTLSHVASGVMLLIFRPFRIGDYIEVAGLNGTVKKLILFMTELSTPDNVQILIPNGKVWDQSIRNYSFNTERRIDMVVGIGYGDDINKAMKTLGDLVAKEGRVLQDPEPMIAVHALADSSVNMLVRVWCKSGDYWPLKFDLQKDAKEALDNAGIEIPFPQRTVHLLKDAS